MRINPKRIAVLAATLALAAPAVAQAGDAVTIANNIARYEGISVSHVHITSVKGGTTGSGTGWDCQSWWRYDGGTYFYSYNMQWFYSFTYKNNGGTDYLSQATTNGVAC